MMAEGYYGCTLTSTAKMVEHTWVRGCLGVDRVDMNHHRWLRPTLQGGVLLWRKTSARRWRRFIAHRICGAHLPLCPTAHGFQKHAMREPARARDPVAR